VNAIRIAAGFLNKISHKATDPLLFFLLAGRKWPPAVTSQGFTAFDYHYWRYRLRQYEQLRPLLPENKTRVPVPELATWFVARHEIVPGHELLLPPETTGRRQASLLSTYLRFSSYVDVNRDRCVIQTDENGNPSHALVFAGDVTYRCSGTLPTITAKPDFSRVTCYTVDLAAGTCEPYPTPTMKRPLTWVKGRSFVYVPTEEYFLRTQILGTVMADCKRFLPVRPPSSRLAELFAVSGNPSTPLSVLKDFCYRGAIDRYDAEFKKRHGTQEKHP
jgi:hypothetical protein